jgi:hypothetical protein
MSADLFASASHASRKRRFLLALLVFAGAMLPASAEACRIAAAQTPILHDTLPPLPPGVVAAEVEIVTDVRSQADVPLEARIVRMISGDYRGSRLRIDRNIVSSCDGVPYPGMRGIVVGRVLSVSDEMLVVDAIRAPSALERQRQRAAQPAADR